jgi:hypothetical protein
MATIQLSEWIRHEEPAAYLVFCPESCVMCEYKVFADYINADRAAHDAQEETGRDWPIYPLYAANPGVQPSPEPPADARRTP